MVKIHQTEDLLAFVKALSKNPRTSVRELHRQYSHYKRRRSTSDLLHNAREDRIILGPKMWCNSGCDLEIFENVDDPLFLLDVLKKRKEITYVTALIGNPPVICFKDGGNMLKYAEAIIPTFPAKKTVKDISLEKKGLLKEDEYPHNWNDTDWSVFYNMRDPSVSFVAAGQKLDISWHTVKDHYEKVLQDCKVWISFFPEGYRSYQQSYVFFKTEYEVGLREELGKLDRSTFIYKFEDKILLHLFLDELLDNRVFYDLKRKGKVHDLHVTVPLGWYSAYW